MDAGRDERAELLGLEREVNATFSAYCSSCHIWSAAMVVRMRTNCGGANSREVKPYDLAASRLFGKVAGSPACGVAMPPKGGLPQAAVESIRAWILRGAPIGGVPGGAADAECVNCTTPAAAEPEDPTLWWRQD